ncbi:MAG: SHOCT domain-containing protein [Crocinitomicaceae bacterium]|nr:SHOCT domain-containing protein [Crocinitomicaceae bacterium]
MSKIFNSSEYGQVFSTKLNNLNELFQVNAISVEEYELKKKLLIRSTEKLVDYSNNLKENQIQIEKLKEALDLEVINEEEYQNKVKKFNEIESVIKQRIDNIKAEDMINNSK